MGPRADLDEIEKIIILPCRESNSDPSVLEPLASRYPGSIKRAKVVNIK
jgi:hypothetical protein